MHVCIFLRKLFLISDLPTTSTDANVRAIHAQALQEFYDHLLTTGNSNCDESIMENDNSLANIAQSSNPLSIVERYSQLLLLLPTLRWFNESVVVELFFSGLIGNLSIETVMPFLLAMDVMNAFESPVASETLAGTNTMVNILEQK